jgi:hypothetical protein
VLTSWIGEFRRHLLLLVVQTAREFGSLPACLGASLLHRGRSRALRVLHVLHLIVDRFQTLLQQRFGGIAQLRHLRLRRFLRLSNTLAKLIRLHQQISVPGERHHQARAQHRNPSRVSARDAMAILVVFIVQFIIRHDS